MNKILIVDDSILNTKMLNDILRDDYEVDSCSNGHDALISVTKNPPDLILLDIVMKGVDGFEVIAKLKQLPEVKDIPVIFITEISDVGYEEKGFALGAVDYITKPFSPGIVQARISAHIQLYKQRKAIESLVMFDGLTGIYNRRAYDGFMEVEWRRAKRENSYISLALLDIDYFKLYNDNYGHLMGDEVLKLLASTIRSKQCRGTDYFARYGGEEFAFVMPMTDADGAQSVAQKVLDSVNEIKIPHNFSEISNHVTISIGGTTAKPQHDDALSNFVELADKMLYLSKNEGRNKVSWSLFN